MNNVRIKLVSSYTSGRNLEGGRCIEVQSEKGDMVHFHILIVFLTKSPPKVIFNVDPRVGYAGVV